jgi:hypothetical protein
MKSESEWQQEEWNMLAGGNAEWRHHIRQLVRVTSYDQVCARIIRALERNAPAQLLQLSCHGQYRL